MWPRSLIVCALALSPALPGCGARAELIVPPFDAAPRPDVATPDASLPDASQPDVSSPPGCMLGPIVVLKRRMEPSFVLSLAAMNGGGFAFTMASGWMGFASPALVTVDDALVETAATATERLETVHSLEGDPRLYTVTSQRDTTAGAPIEHAFYQRNPRLERQPLGRLCADCAAVDRPIAQRGATLAVPIGTGALDSGGAQLLEAATGALGARMLAMDLRAPAVIATSEGWYAVSQSAGGALARALFALDGGGARVLASQMGFDGASGPWIVRTAGDGLAVVGMSRGGGRTVPLTMNVWNSAQTLAAGPDVAITVGAAGPTSQGLSVASSAARGLIAIAWGEQTGTDGAGAWLTVVNERGRPVFEQQLASDRAANAQSYTVYTAVAPHPEGFVLAYNAWQPQANYAIYGRVVRCR